MSDIAVSFVNSTTGRIQFPRWLRASLSVTDAVAPALASKVLHRMYFHPQRLRVRPAEHVVLAKATRFEVTADGPAVGYAWGTSGPVVGLVHGWSGHVGQLTPLVEPLLARGFRVVGFDWPGHGASSGGVSSLRHGVATLRAVERLVGGFNAIVAHSFGAAATTLALLDGMQAQRVVFQAPSVRLAPYLLGFSDALGLSLDRFNRFVAHSERWLEAPFRSFEPMMRDEVPQAPLHIIHSRDDREVALGDVSLLHSRWKHSTLHLVDGLGHRKLLRDPACIEETVEFLAPT